MSKRTATSNLTKDNWDEDEVAEEMGVFQKAGPNELKMRQIKRAKRRGVMDDGERESIFKNFKAFESSSTDSTAPTFSFLSGNSVKPTLTNVAPFPSFSFNNSSDSTKTNSNKSFDSIKTSPEKSNLPTFSFSTSNSATDKFAEKNISNSKKEEESESKGIKFGFDAGSNKALEKTPTAFIPTFNFNPTKTSESNSISKSGIDTSFKFGINPEDKEPSKISSKDTPFQFGINKEPETSKSSPTPKFQFGINKEQESKSSPKPAFQFGTQSSSNGNTSKSSPLTAKSDNLKEKSCLGGAKETPKSSPVNGVGSNSHSTSGKKKLFLANLKALNTGVLDWVKQHVDKNQYINLSPIFDDYKKHFQQIKNKYDPTSSNQSSASEDLNKEIADSGSSVPESQTKATAITSTSLFSFSASSSSPSKSLFGASSVPLTPMSSSTKELSQTPEVKPFSFGLNDSNSKSLEDKNNSSESSTNKASGSFSFGLKDNKPTAAFSFGKSESKSSFSFGSSDDSKKASSGFSFGGSKETKSSGFSFEPSTSATPSSAGFSFKADPSSTNFKAASNDTEEDASDEVPKVEVKEVKEEDAIYEKKVKLFYKKADKYVDRGVGTLFLKPAGDKTQLLIRALTNLGNILLNIILNESIPTQRMGKNNVLIVCVPNPPIDPSATNAPVSMLIRVKTESDADDLLEKIDEHKK
ncbi:UNVERIFIED_CONTAM: hypothetical protein GTU68_023853 [Idotea baltica]|nr:hypothetical protein [Idotea baltica]